MSVVLVILAGVIFLGSVAALRPGLSAGGSVSFFGFDGQSVLVAFAFFVACAMILGIPFGFPLILALLMRELGQVLAHRMLGHKETRFRLVPFLGPRSISDQPLKTDGEEFLIAIMGSVLALGPVAMSAALAVALHTPAPELSNILWLSAATLGAFNFVILLPFAPFDGARCMRCAVASYWPALTPAMAVFMSTAMFTASLRTGSLLLMGAAAFGVQSLLHRSATGRAPLKPDHGLIALSAYVFTLAAHFSAGWWLFQAQFG